MQGWPVSVVTRQHAVAPPQDRTKVTILHKSDIVAKAVSVTAGESVAMPKAKRPKQGEDMTGGRALLPDDPVGAALRRLHDEVVAEPIPDEFLKLLAEIEQRIEKQTGQE